MRIPLLLAVVGLILGAGCATTQRRLLYHPTHQPAPAWIETWKQGGKLFGYARTVPNPRNVWLLVHGNGGQASDRSYAFASFAAEDSIYVLEYPGYGQREGIPSFQSFNTAAWEAYELLRQKFPRTPVCVAGESIGTGPACSLATNPHPPEKIVLVVPFELLSKVVSNHIALIPPSWLLRDNWNNIEALTNYAGRLEIFAATDDTVIPVQHAKALAASKPNAVFHEFSGGHNDWPKAGRVSIRNP